MYDKIEEKTVILPPFKHFIMSIGEIPSSYLETMTYYEMLVWFTNYLGNTVIPAINENGEAVTELQNLFVELQNYVNNYFENLDVQEEINNKLDQMLEDGVLQEIIEQFIQSNALWNFDTVENMKNATNLINGSYAKTLGYYEINDGGEATYKIRTKTEEDVIDDGSIIAIGEELVAELIYNNEIKTKQFGAVGDGTTNDTTQIQKLFDFIVKENKGIKIIVNGFHLVNNGLTIAGASNNYLKNICLSGIDGNRNYGNVDSIINGFKFVADYTTTSQAFNNTTGILFNYCYSPVIEYLKITSNESVENGDIPLNNTTALKFTNSNGARISYCNITNVYTGIFLSYCGLANINANNISFCNIGIRLSSSGDNTLKDNYINTCGWNIRELNGTLKSKYTSLNSLNLVYGFGIYYGDGGNSTITGGKIEWNNVGIWQDYTMNNIISNIQLDRCSTSGIALTGHGRYVRTTISNNNFSGCGGLSYSEPHIGGIGGSSIGVNQGNGVLINGNKIYGDDGSLYGSFKKSDTYYGPLEPIKILNTMGASIVNNIIKCDSNYSLTLTNTETLFDGNIHNKDYYRNPNTITYKINFNRKEVFQNTDATIGNYDIGDILINPATYLPGWKVTVGGTLGSINTNVTVINSAIDHLPGDGTVIDLGTTYVQNLSVGAYINIAGVTGTKKITDIIFLNSHFYAKLNSACDVAVINAAATNQAPTFTSL